MNAPDDNLPTLEQIDARLAVLRRRGDCGQTPELFEDERIAARRAVERQRAAEFARRARGDDLPMFATA